MLENIVGVNVFVKMLIVAVISVLSLNVIVGFVSFCVRLKIKRKKL